MHFTFDREEHVYRLEDGRQVESVTGVLEDNRLLPNYSRLDPFYAERGTAVHHALALHVLGKLDWSSLDEYTQPAVDRGARFLETLSIEPRVIEQPWVHRAYSYGGTVDLFALSDLGPICIDWKCGGFEPGHRIQLAGGYFPLLEDAARDGALPLEPEEVRTARYAIVPLTAELPRPVWIRRSEFYQQQQLFREALSLTRWRRLHTN